MYLTIHNDGSATLTRDNLSSTSLELGRRHELRPGRAVMLQPAGRYSITILIQEPKPGGSKWKTVEALTVSTTAGDQDVDLSRPIDAIPNLVAALPESIRSKVERRYDSGWLWYQGWCESGTEVATDGELRMYGDSFAVDNATWAISYIQESGGDRRFTDMYIGPGAEDHLPEIQELLASMSNL